MALWVQAGTCPPRHRSNLNFQETSWCRCRVSRGCRLISAYCDYLFKTLGDTLAQRGRGKGGGLTKKRIPVKLFRALCSCKTRAGVGDITIPLGRDASAALTERLCLVGWLTGAHHSSAELLMILQCSASAPTAHLFSCNAGSLHDSLLRDVDLI